MKARVSILALLLFALADPALAVDGVREISKVCALNGGCFSGDTGGFPVTITQPGSYVLTTDLQLSNALNGIEITASDVSLDLNGFALKGTGTSCLGTGILAIGASRVSVEGGRVTEFGNGVDLGARSRVDRMEVDGFDGTGVEVSGAIMKSHVFDVGVRCNLGHTGVRLSGGVAVSNSIGGSEVGIDASGAVIRGNTVTSNGTAIDASNSRVSDNVVPEGADWAIDADTSVIRGNTVDNSIRAYDSQLTDNTVVTMGEPGLVLDADSGFSKNTIVASPAVTGGVDQGGNACNGSPSC